MTALRVTRARVVVVLAAGLLMVAAVAAQTPGGSPPPPNPLGNPLLESAERVREDAFYRVPLLLRTASTRISTA
jgi:hypothetical protein